MRHIRNANAPRDAIAITPTDNTTNAKMGSDFADMLWVGVSGTVTIRKPGGQGLTAGSGTTLDVPSVIPGVWHYMPGFINVEATGTTATGILVGVSFPNEG